MRFNLKKLLVFCNYLISTSLNNFSIFSNKINKYSHFFNFQLFSFLIPQKFSFKLIFPSRL